LRYAQGDVVGALALYRRAEKECEVSERAAVASNIGLCLLDLGRWFELLPPER
jgi:hypothetical protein